MEFTLKDINNDPKVKKIFIKKGLAENTRRNYRRCLKKFCSLHEKSFSDMIDELIIEQRDRIIKKDGEMFIVKYDPNMGTIGTYFDLYIQYCRDIGNKDTSVETDCKVLRTAFNFYKIQLPDCSQFEDDHSEWYLLKKSMIENAIELGNIMEKAIFSFAASKGDRKEDIENYTIGDFMQATYPYHQCEDLEEFLKNNVRDMIGYWDTIPLKTKRHGIQCLGCNSQESSNYIMDSLYLRLRKINEYNKAHGTNIKLEKSDGLFAPFTKFFTNGEKIKKYSSVGITHMFFRMDKKLHALEVQKYDLLLKNEKISKETYDEKIEKIPKFSAHQLRKYFISTLRNNGINLAIAYKMEGHAPQQRLDKNYVKINKQTIQDAYMTIIKELTFSNIEVHHIKSEDYIILEKQLNKVTKELEEKKKEDKKRDELIDENMQILQDIDPKVLRALLEKK
jgi:site-specific recombinase XerD